METIRRTLAILLFCAGVCVGQGNPVPFVNQPLVPDATAPGGPDFTLIVNGTGFVNGATVNWNGTALVTTFVNQGQLTSTVPAADIATAGTASVTVTNPAPSGGTSNIQYFSVRSSVATVTLTELGFTSGLNNIDFSHPAQGDFNNDGVTDLVIGSADSGTCLFLGVGDGSFLLPKCLKSGGGEVLMQVADFNADGNLDVAWAYNAAGCGGQVLLGNGDGTLRAGSSFAGDSCDGSVALTSADINGDGALDLLAVTFLRGEWNTVSVYPGIGDGTFSPRIDTRGNYDPGPVALADFDGDGKLDLASGDYLMLGNGEGTFQPALHPFAISATQLFASDINDDGKLDVIALTAKVAVLRGNGDGTFQPEIDADPGITPSGFAIGDLNGDGKLDVAVLGTQPNTASISILLGNNDGTFQSPSLIPMTGHPASLLLTDFNRDGAMDLWGLGGSPDITVLLQGEFPTAVVSPLAIDFPRQTPGVATSPKAITLKNAGVATMTISSIAIGGSNPGDFSQTNTCASSLAAGATCQISVIFTPTLLTDRSAILQVSDNAPGSPQTVSFSGLVADFSVSPNSDTSQTVTAGQAANYSVSVASGSGFDGTIALTCSSVPPGATCTVTANVAVVTTAGSGGLTAHVGSSPNWWIFGFGGSGSLALILMLLMRDGRWSWQRRYVAGLCCVLLAAAWTGCGGARSGGGGGTPNGTYTLKIAGTYTAGGVTVNHSTNFTLVVK